MASKKGKRSKKGGAQARTDSSHVEEKRAKTEVADSVANAEDELADNAEAGDATDSKDSVVKKEVVPKSRAPKKAGKSTGVLALFDHPDTTLEAAKKTRDRGFEKWDVYTPFPVHGMDEAMGLGRSPVPWITFTMGVVGFCAAVIIQFGTMVYSWPLNFGGKPFAAWPSFVPISFEMTVFAAGVSTALGSLFLGGVFKLRKRVAHPHVTSHRFAIFVEASDPKYDEGKTLSLFEEAGAIEVRAVKEGE